MKTKMIFWGVMFLLLATSCDKNDEAFPTDKDRDWFEIKDDPNDPLTHLIYTIYKETGISVYYNDTIGREDRGVDLDGNPLIHYEILNPFYTLGSSTQNAKFSLCQDKETIMQTVMLLQNSIKQVPKNLWPRSFLIVDELVYIEQYKPDAPVSVHQGLMTTLVQATFLQTEEEKHAWSFVLLSTLVSNALNEEHESELNQFFAVSEKIMDGWGMSIYGMFMDPGMPWFNPEAEQLGFIVYETIVPSVIYMTPNRKEDLNSYVLACYEYDVEEFEAKYSAYPLVLQKFKMIHELVSHME